MQWIAMVFPSFMSVALSEMMEGKKYTGAEFVKFAGVYALFSNFISMVIYQYVLKTPTSFLTNFADNSFLIHYMILNIFFAAVLPVLKLAINPHIHVKVERRDTKEEEE